MKQSGFSLVELLVVIVILSITVVFVTLAFGDFGKGKNLIIQGQQFVNFLEFSRQYAMVTNQPVIIEINAGNYTIKNVPEKRLNSKLLRNNSFNGINITGTNTVSINQLGELSNFKIILTSIKNPKAPLKIESNNNNLIIHTSNVLN